MKTIIQLFATFLLFLMLGFSYAQVPQAFNYQAVARNEAGNVLPDQAIGIRVSLHEGSESGDVVYSETFAPTTNDFGLFTLAIGTGTVVSGNFSTINWSDYQYWLQVEMDMTGGTTYANMGASKLLSVPYAMYAAKTEPSMVGTVPGTSFSYGHSNQPSATSVIEWSGPKATLTITSPDQKILVIANVVMGAGSIAANGLKLYTAYSLTSASAPTPFGAGSYNMTCPVYTRLSYSTTGIVTGLSPGTYYFGAAVSVSDLNWTNNEYGTVTAIIINP